MLQCTDPEKVIKISCPCSTRRLNQTKSVSAFHQHHWQIANVIHKEPKQQHYSGDVKAFKYYKNQKHSTYKTKSDFVKHTRTHYGHLVYVDTHSLRYSESMNDRTRNLQALRQGKTIVIGILIAVVAGSSSITVSAAVAPSFLGPIKLEQRTRKP